MSGGPFAGRLIRWQATHGRHDLPWQTDPSPYRVWLSEVMLQQTQVQTVIPYFERFTARFPDVEALAAAELDEVLHLWSGLGYYSRARHLHRAARRVVEQHGGTFPDDADALTALPGIGRSTAGAIRALAFEQPAAILDGNVKRVLARYHGERGWPGESAVQKRLWAHAERALPKRRVRAYTQALMDLGAMLCTRRRPRCGECPLRADCAAHHAGEAERYPAPRPRRTLPERRTCLLIIEDDDGRVLLERRPPRGVWGGLWCFPEIPDTAALPERAAQLGIEDYEVIGRSSALTHTFTHFRLAIEPLRLRATAMHGEIRDHDALHWYSARDSTRIGLSAPVARLLAALEPPRRRR